MSLPFTVVLEECYTLTVPPPTVANDGVQDSRRGIRDDVDVTAALEDCAAKTGAALSRSSTTRHQAASPSRFTKMHYYGGMPPDVTTITDILTFAGAGVTAFAFFFNNVLDIALKWQKLSRGRSVTVTIAGEEFVVKDGEDMTRRLHAAMTAKAAALEAPPPPDET